MTEPENNSEEIVLRSEGDAIVETKPETWGPEKPPRLLLFGRRYETPRGVRHRPDKRRTPIGQRVDKATRRYFRYNFGKLYSIRNGLFDKKTISVDAELEEAHKFKALARENSENSHEAKRLYEKDRKWRRDERKKAMREDWVKRTQAGDLLRPIGVQPTRAEKKAARKQHAKELKAFLKQQELADRMGAAIGLPSGNTTAPSQEP